MSILFSLCHATRRLPDGWKPAVQAWFDNCDRPETVEHILGIHVDSGAFVYTPFFPSSRLAVNHMRSCSVDNWNQAARESNPESKILITLADDLFPSPHWDTELLWLISPDFDHEAVFDVDSGASNGLISHGIMTRAYFNRLTRDYGYQGGIWYPEYLGMRVDDDLTMLARKDGVVIPAKHLRFEHRHPQYGTAEWDDVYRLQHSEESFRIGDQVLERRKKEFGIISV